MWLIRYVAYLANWRRGLKVEFAASSSGRYEWAEVVHDRCYRPEATFRLEFNWLALTGARS